jgi:hypothetical protein
MATISKAGIVNGQAIQAQQILNIIEALDGTSPTTILVTGSLQGSSSYALSSSYAVTASYTLNGGLTRNDLYQHLNPTVSTLNGAYAPTINAQRETFVTLNGITSSLTINNPITSSTSMEGDKLVFRIKDNGVATQSLSFSTVAGGYAQRGVGLPTTTAVLGKISTTTFLFNLSASKWDCVGYVLEY